MWTNKVHAHFLEELDVLFTRLATNLHPSMQLGDLSILQSNSLASIQKKVFIKTVLCWRIFNSLGGGGSRRKRRNMPLSSQRNIDGFITMSHHNFWCPSIQVERHTKNFVDWCFYAIFWNIIIMIRSVGREHVGTVMRRNCYGDYGPEGRHNFLPQQQCASRS